MRVRGVSRYPGPPVDRESSGNSATPLFSRLPQGTQRCDEHTALSFHAMAATPSAGYFCAAASSRMRRQVSSIHCTLCSTLCGTTPGEYVRTRTLLLGLRAFNLCVIAPPTKYDRSVPRLQLRSRLSYSTMPKSWRPSPPQRATFHCEQPACLGTPSASATCSTTVPRSIRRLPVAPL